jgi:mono/diheme cytochrome c family protein
MMKKTSSHPFLFLCFSLATALSLLSACEPAMNHEAKEHPYEPSHFFANGALAQHAVDGTIDRSPLKKLPTSPNSVTMSLLKRGQSRFTIYCAPCHADNADGHGMIVQHGFLSPPALYNDDLRGKPASFFYGVITNGFGAMYSYADRLAPEDRWAVASYIQALQLSQHFSYQQLTEEEKRQMKDQEPENPR